MNVARQPSELASLPRAVALGTFDGVHRGHREVIRAAVDTGLRPTVVTFDPHPRRALGKRVELLCSLDRRLELLEANGVEDVLVMEFTPATAELSGAKFAADVLGAIGAEVVVGGEGFRFGRGQEGDCDLLRSLGLDAREVPLVPGVSSTRIRGHATVGEMQAAAKLLGRPFELDGVVVGGDRRGGTLGFPTANLQVGTDAPRSRPTGSTRARSTTGVRRCRSASTRISAAPSAASRPTSSTGRATCTATGSSSSSGDDSATERAFGSDEELIAQIARDVEETRAATRP